MPAVFTSRPLIAALAAGSLALGVTVRAQSSSPGFAVVELFTSEGCSSCPPADALLAEIDGWAEKNNASVYALSFHVDYWDRLGWTDPYGSPANSERQRSYAAASNQGSVYTPQMIVNGEQSFVGSNGKQAAAALGEALAAGSTVALRIESTPAAGNSITVRYETTGAPAGAVLSFALVQPAGTQSVTRGENAGRKLVHVNVVRTFRQSRVESSGAGTVSLERPAAVAGPLETIAYLQQTNTGRVLAAASASAP